jgi:hypothetical protein
MFDAYFLNVPQFMVHSSTVYPVAHSHVLVLKALTWHRAPSPWQLRSRASTVLHDPPTLPGRGTVTHTRARARTHTHTRTQTHTHAHTHTHTYIHIHLYHSGVRACQEQGFSSSYEAPIYLGPVTLTSFGWDDRPRSSVCTHAEHQARTIKIQQSLSLAKIVEIYRNQ